MIDTPLISPLSNIISLLVLVLAVLYCLSLSVLFCLQGTVDFYQDWNNYSNGFGNLSGEFWLGLEKIHRVTKNENVTMRIDMEDFNGGSLYAEYNSFVVGSARENFTLSLGSFKGTHAQS